jgi:hypothetical protein
MYELKAFWSFAARSKARQKEFQEIAVSNALETREDLVLLRRLNVVNNVDERT